MATAFAVLLTVAAVLAWLNERFVKIPTTVGVTLAGALASILLIVLDTFGLTFGVRQVAESLLTTLDFSTFVLNGILSILLFAGAMSLDARQLLRQRASILTLAGVSTVVSTVLIGLASWGVFRLVGLDVPLVWSLLFGALISPTDPVAVLDLLRRAKVPKRIEALIAGESLFNDGVGIVLFIVIAGAAGVGGTHGGDPSVLGAVAVFAQEALGGLAFGAVLGWVGYQMCRSVDGHVVEVLLTLAMVVGGYLAATALGVSGPLAMVIAGLAMSAGKEAAFDGATREQVLGFWETLDQVVNILLFAFIGLDVLLTATTVPQILASLMLIVVALGARFVSVWLPLHFMRVREGYGAWTVRLLTWGGLRGGIAISLALGLPDSPYRTHIVTVTYAIVLFTIAVQGLTVMPIVHKSVAAAPRSVD
ncbi:MAG: sodium:proton antiporter [Candidatus Phosphoribacter sp.]